MNALFTYMERRHRRGGSGQAYDQESAKTSILIMSKDCCFPVLPLRIMAILAIFL